MLTRPQMREQHDLAVREFQSIVMSAGIVQVDLLEPRDFVRERPRVPPEHAELKSGKPALDRALECDLGAGKEAHGECGFSEGGKPGRSRIPELRSDQFVSNLGWSGCDAL
jgi:hypothetical protein